MAAGVLQLRSRRSHVRLAAEHHIDVIEPRVLDLTFTTTNKTNDSESCIDLCVGAPLPIRDTHHRAGEVVPFTCNRLCQNWDD